MKRCLLVAAATVIGACAAGPAAVEPPPEAEVAIPELPAVPEPAPLPPPPPPSPPRPLTVAAVGDIMMGTDFPANRLPPDDGAATFASFADQLRGADIAFGNLEGVLLDGGEPFKVCKNPDLCYLFRTPSRYIQHLVDAGFDVVSLANNHARDFGEEGRGATMATLDAAGIMHSGRDGDIASWFVDGRPVAMVAFAPNPGSHSILDIDAAVRLVASVAATHDLVIVSFHGGAEGLDALHVPNQMEQYYGEDRGNLIAFSHAVVDAGADLVIGHGPHVPRGLEIYCDRLIAYSLGNFATYQGISVAGIKGVAPILFATLAPDGAFIGGRIVSGRQQRPHGTVPDADEEALELMQRLSTEDFGAAAPTFSRDGTLTP